MKRKWVLPSLRSEWLFYRMENLPDAKIPGKWERKWPEMAKKWTPKWENGAQNGSLALFPFRGPFLAISGLGPFTILFPIFRDLYVGQVFHSVNGHSDRITKPSCSAPDVVLQLPKLGRGHLWHFCFVSVGSHPLLPKKVHSLDKESQASFLGIFLSS